jgi:hypothetical protein
VHGVYRVRLVALVDSGADASLFDAGYADFLGLKRQDAELITATAASGAQIDCLRWPDAKIELHFANQRFPFMGAFADFSVQADGENLLGRADFFQSFIVQFWESAQLMNIDLSPNLSSQVVRRR